MKLTGEYITNKLVYSSFFERQRSLKTNNKRGKNNMKKDLIFTPVMVVIALMLFLLKATGMTAHIAVSAVGVLVLIVYAVLTKKEWKLPALEIIMRAFYGIALITGIVIMNVHGIVALAIVHKVSAVLFVASLVALFVYKVFFKKKI